MSTIQDEPRVSDLVSNALASLSKLLQDEIQLARLELTEKISSLGGSAKLMAAGVFLMIPASVMLMMAIAAGIMAAGLAPAYSYLISAALGACLGGLLILLGARRLSAGALTPSVTLNELRRDKTMAKELMR